MFPILAWFTNGGKWCAKDEKNLPTGRFRDKEKFKEFIKEFEIIKTDMEVSPEYEESQGNAFCLHSRGCRWCYSGGRRVRVSGICFPEFCYLHSIFGEWICPFPGIYGSNFSDRAGTDFVAEKMDKIDFFKKQPIILYKLMHSNNI